MTIKMDIDAQWQMFIQLSLSLDKHSTSASFKIDTGSGMTILSHTTLRKMGYKTTPEVLSKLPVARASTVVGSLATFRRLGKVSFYINKTLLFTVDAVCHPTKETHDLLGADALCQYPQVLLNFRQNSFIELGV